MCEVEGRIARNGQFANLLEPDLVRRVITVLGEKRSHVRDEGRGQKTIARDVTDLLFEIGDRCFPADFLTGQPVDQTRGLLQHHLHVFTIATQSQVKNYGAQTGGSGEKRYVYRNITERKTMSSKTGQRR